MTDERTSLFAEPRPAPSYVFPGRHPRIQQRPLKRFQCWICTSFLCVLIIALALTIAYTVIDDANNDNNNDTQENETRTRPTRSPNRLPAAKDVSPNEIVNMLLVATWPLNDEPMTHWKLMNTNESDRERAIDMGIKALGDKELFEETLVSPEVNSPSYKHQRAVGTTPEARKLTKRGYVENHATKLLAKNTSFQHIRERWNIGQGPSTKLMPLISDIKCNFNSRYSTANGTCNNRHNPFTFGVAMTPFRRALNPDYADGISEPRLSHIGNETLPSARQVSTSIHRPSFSSDPNFTVMLAVFGQFLDHDITATALNQGPNGEPIQCCPPSKTMHPECFPVPLGPGDPNYEKYNLTCMNFVRSAPAPTGRFGPRQQLNQATAFIDGSVVYGTSDERQQALRSNANGLLRMFNTPDNRTLLPVSTDPTDGCNEAEKNSKGQYCFESGDSRANENLHLTSMHLIWARHHNYIAANLQTLNPDWENDMVFQESRKILAAQLQHITYNEFLPVILGDEFSRKIGITSNPQSQRDTYDQNVDASIANAFAACAFRFAHTLIPGLMKVTKDTNTTEGIELHKMLFNPYSLWGTGGLDSALDSAINTSLAKSDQYFTTELTQKLFQNIGSSSASSENSTGTPKKLPGLDLVSLNIQRGRDHGLPSYTEWRKYCQLPTVDTWDDMKYAVSTDSYYTMISIFKHPVDVDVYTGALSEIPMNGAIIGPLLSCLITDQFIRLKKGDSFWYERKIGPQRFTKDQLNQIYNTTLAGIICRNSDAVEYSQAYVMRKAVAGNEIVNCNQLDRFDFNPWKDKNAGSSRSQPRFEKQNFIKLATEQMKVSIINEEPKNVFDNENDNVNRTPINL